MDIRLDGIELVNFKGIEAFAFAPGGKGATIRGDNSTGKTTIADACRWLLFGKDTGGRADFAIKTLDGQGSPIHNLDHSVEAVFLVDEAPLRLKKVLKEKWTKKRGQTRKEFTGHTTDHYIDGVPVKKKEWDERIGALIDEETFKLLTSPSYFNDLHWQKRREILLQVCGDVTDDEVIASDEALATLPEILGDRSIEDQKKVVAARRKEINRRLEEIPARIDELRKSVAEAPKEPRAIEAQIDMINQKIETAKNDSGLSALRKEKAEKEAELAELRGKHREVIEKHDREQGAKEREAEERKEKVQAEVRRLDSEIGHAEEAITHLKGTTANNEREMERLRKEYREEDALEFQGATQCPTCGQALPEDQVEAARARHNESKAQVLADINRKGKLLREQNEEKAREIEKREKKVAELEAAKKPLQADIDLADDAIRRLKAAPVERPASGHEEAIAALEKEIADLEVKIKNRPAPDTAALEQELKEAQGRLADFRSAEKAKARVGELEAEEKALSAEFEGLEHETHLMEKFIVTKVGMLEDRVAEKFELVRFKMFEEQINGGITETCTTTVDGVPYGLGLNHGAEINAGLDIIRTLSAHYGITAPIFVDGAESVTKLIGMDCQVIRLVVDETKPEMEVQYHE